MNASNSSATSTGKTSRWRRPLLIGALAAGLGGALFASGCGRHAQAHGWGGHHGHHSMDPQAATERAEFAADWVLNKVNANDTQRQQIKGIVKSAVNDLLPLRDQHRTARKAMMEALAQPTIDRQKLRLLQAVADAAEVLTPEQRAELAKLAARHRG
jgi:periplasmic protein CpxP/Spy